MKELQELLEKERLRVSEAEKRPAKEVRVEVPDETARRELVSPRWRVLGAVFESFGSRLGWRRAPKRQRNAARELFSIATTTIC